MTKRKQSYCSTSKPSEKDKQGILGNAKKIRTKLISSVG